MLNLIAFGIMIFLHLLTVHKVLIWALGGLGMGISILLMMFMLGVAVDEVDR